MVFIKERFGREKVKEVEEEKLQIFMGNTEYKEQRIQSIKELRFRHSKS